MWVCRAYPRFEVGVLDQAYTCAKVYAMPTNLLESLKFAGTSMLGRSAL